ncbi:MAG TPA: pyridoxamine 5'-phosphate oxidase [Acidimicrobiales bacterium]|jgi:pyridoxamine 5'-phosphate oxidase|nr:pyridoxamine 5'-phosphate oxidase [Acidimicrobiales bacterium]
MDLGDIDPDPITQFKRWLDDATASLPEPSAMVLATADASGRPSARHVLLKGIDERGFVWFTNYESAKARDLRANPRAALVFPWFPIRRQVIVSGSVTTVDEAESDDYFATRDRRSQISAWASPQSEVIADREWLVRRVVELEARFEGADVPRPPFWGGYRLTPDRIDLWYNQPDRLHDRFRYERTEDGWEISRLAP